ncbi:MAG: hypothetical protein N3A38_10690, partial [Planctomycetota bacterium]|nr:hypothetical protein [Planctomycetota bacterium]
MVQEGDKLTRLPRAFYCESIATFVGLPGEIVLGKLTANSEVEIKPEQINAWQQEIRILQMALRGINGTLFLEFNIPRMG